MPCSFTRRATWSGVHRFVDGVPTLIKEHAVIPKKRTPWHFLRIQRNTIVSKEFFEISFDNQFFLSVYDSTFHTGQIGLVTTGGGAFAFDNLRVVELLTSRPPLSTACLLTPYNPRGAYPRCGKGKLSHKPTTCSSFSKNDWLGFPRQAVSGLLQKIEQLFRVRGYRDQRTILWGDKPFPRLMI